jgi:predicted RecA/RadA family phage recombinase
MLNEKRQDRPGNAVRLAVPSTCKSGDAILAGQQPGVLLTDYDSATGTAVVRFTGTFNLTVYSETVHSPQTASVIKPGDKLYAAGTLDSGTNITTVLILNAASGGVFFGYLASDEAAMSSGANAKVGVRLG